MAQKKAKKLAPLSRMPSVREEVRTTTQACDTAARQIRDDTVMVEMEHAVGLLGDTVRRFGNIWMCGNGTGFSLAVSSCHKLSTQLSKLERPTRSNVLGLNLATASTSYGKLGIEESMSAELMVHGREIDCLWCFASDPTSRSLLGAATKARNELKIPVVLFTVYPGTPLIRFSDAKVRIHASDERDRAGYCVDWAHSFLANILCSQLKRIARRTRS